MESLMNVIGGGGTRSGRRGRSGLTPVTTGCIRLVGLCCMLLLPVAVGLYQDEAGKLDFTIRTAGHGPVRWAYVWPQPSTISTATSTDASKSSILLTTDARETSSSSSSTTPSSCYLAGRNITTGAVLWRRNVCVESSSLSKMKPVTSFVVSAMDNTVVTVNNRGILQAWDALSGALLWDTLLDPQEQQQQQLQSYTSLTLAMLDSTGSGSSPTLRSNGIVENGDSVTVVLVESSSVTFPDRRIMGWNAQTGEVLRPDQMVGSAIDMKQALQTMKDRSDSSLIQSSCLDTIFTGQDHTVAASQGGNAHWEGTVDDPVIFLQTISCDESTGTTLLVSTSRGSTTVLKWSHGNQFQTLWHAEEGLASVTTAYLVDNSHYQVGDDSDSHKDKLLSFSYRIQAQWKALASLGKETAASRRDHLFGFVKVAVLLSPSTHRIFGLTTVGTNTRGQVIWKLNLPPNTHTHRLVHGAPNAAHSVHGINGITHSKDFLVISWSDEQIFWNCFDGTNGLVHDAGMKRIKQPVKQIIPILAHGKCRQGALLLFHDNESVVLLPPTEPAPDHVSAAMRTGWYTHVIDQETNTLTTLKIHDTMRTTVTGMAAFPGEQIVTVSYPSRDEVIQSPSQVLGDDSVLLKYINPHLAVIVTMINDPVPDEWASVLLRQKNFTPRSKTTKPMGVTPTSDPIETEMVVPPNLFINVVDTITGRILYRASHSNAAGFPIPQVLISENWVIYTYQNIKTRRMELGVLALYEGMIHSKGITAFTSPDHSTVFSSLDARDTKPVVLAKTYSLPKTATSMAMTQSRNGISNRLLLLALQDGQITGIDRRAVDPRRPVGALNDNEKKEGLRQYSELVGIVPFMSLSYHQAIESVTGIISAPTDLESQSLVLAYGGPDLFFTRTSPSRGFDLLPDSFSRSLLSVVVAGLLILYLVTERMAKKKIKQHGWI